MTVAHGYMDRAIFTVLTNDVATKEKEKAANTIESPPLDTKSETFRSLRMVAALCNRADFVEEDVRNNVPLQDRRTTSDASETALLKFLETISSVRTYRQPFHEVYLLPFNSHLKFQISIRQSEVHTVSYINTALLTLILGQR